jgi:hypothetical protein
MRSVNVLEWDERVAVLGEVGQACRSAGGHIHD